MADPPGRLFDTRPSRRTVVAGAMALAAIPLFARRAQAASRLADLARRLAGEGFGTGWQALAPDLVPSRSDALAGSAFRISAAGAEGGSGGAVTVIGWSGGEAVGLLEAGSMGFRIDLGSTAAPTLLQHLGTTGFALVPAGMVAGSLFRALTLRAADPLGEEHPGLPLVILERVGEGTEAPLVLDALVDSPSTTGVLSLRLRPGSQPGAEISLTLYPRRPLSSLGLAPLSATFLHAQGGQAGLPQPDDWRPAVHDARGLLMVNGRGERLWRPLLNPPSLQISAFADDGPRLYGLIQRPRAASAYDGAEGSFERRPSLSVEPVGSWGRGFLTLIEVPARSEANDNVLVAFQPAAPLAPGIGHPFHWRLGTTDEPAPAPHPPVIVASVRSGAGDAPARRMFVIDHVPADGQPPGSDHGAVSAWASGGMIVETRLSRHPDGRFRTAVTVERRGADPVDIRVDLHFRDRPPAEVAMLRWP